MKNNSIKYFALAVFPFLVILIAMTWSRSSEAQSLAESIRFVRSMDVDRTTLPYPAGIIYSSRLGEFRLLQGSANPTILPVKSVLQRLSPFGDLTGSDILEVLFDNPLSLTMDNRSGRMLIFQATSQMLLVVQEDASGALLSMPRTSLEASALHLHEPQGTVVNPVDNSLYFLDAVLPELVVVRLPTTGSLDASTIRRIPLQLASSSRLHGLAIDPANANLFSLDLNTQSLIELSSQGRFVASHDLSFLHLVDPQGMVIAPSSDQTDDPSLVSLYLADRGTPGSKIEPAEHPLSSGSGTAGRIIELALHQPAVQQLPAVFNSELVRTTDLAALDPPSPDACGAAYIPARNTLLLSDSEVEEVVVGITHFQGANLWELNLDGTLVYTANISTVAPTHVPMSNEPTGVAWNPAKGHYYVSDDKAVRIFDLYPGWDDLYGTADDTWTSFSPLGFGDGDPEGIAFDSWRDRLIIMDGVNREVYEYTLSGELILHFDVLQYGIVDPETVEFNPLSGTLFIMSSSNNRLIIETSIDGSLIQSIDFSASKAIKPAGLVYAPASDGSGAMHFYIVDRGVDNNIDPHIIDAKLFEMTAPVTNIPANTPPVVNAGPDLSIHLIENAILSGSVMDDGMPNPPGKVTTQWSMVSGPGVVTFGNPNEVVTSASFSIYGSYILSLSADDGEYKTYDEIRVTVLNHPTYLPLITTR